MVDNGRCYIVPVNFGYEMGGNRLVLYLHSAMKGRKIDILQNNPQVCFEMDFGKLEAGETACAYTYRYASVIGNGKAEMIHEKTQKEKALRLLMKQQTGKDFDFQNIPLDGVAVLQITADTFTCKSNLE